MQIMKEPRMADSVEYMQQATTDTAQQHAEPIQRTYGAYTRILIGWFIGMCEALLLLRLTARLFAARSSNPVIQMLYAVTDPVVRPLHSIDAQQPRFGAVLELSTMATMLSIFLVGYLLWKQVGDSA